MENSFLKLLLLFAFGFVINSSFGQSIADYRSRVTGNWNTAGNWEKFDGSNWVTSDSVPNSTKGVITILSGHNMTLNVTITLDQVVIENGGTLTQTANTLTLNDGTGTDLTCLGTLSYSGFTLNGAGSLQMLSGATFNWGGSTISGTGEVIIENGATLNLNGTTKTLGGNRRLINRGIVNHTAGNFHLTPSTSASDTAWFINEGILNVTDQLYSISSGKIGKSIITNTATGVINKSNAGNVTFANGIDLFTNSGLINVNTGGLLLNAAIVEHRSVINLTDGTSMTTSSTHLVQSGAVFNGPGSISISAGTFTLQTDLILSTAPLTFTAGIINGSAKLVIAGTNSFTWGGNSISGSNEIIIESAATLTLNGTTKTLSGNRRLINKGIVNHTAGNFHLTPSTSASDTAWFINEGILNVTDQLYSISSGKIGKSIITNTASGIINKSNAGSVTFANGIDLFTNSGIINVNTGGLLLNAAIVEHRSVINLAGGTSMTTSSTHLVQSGAVFNGPGSISISAGTFTLQTDLTLSTVPLNMTGGTINGSSKLTIASGNNFTWGGTPCTITGSGEVIIESGATLNLNGTGRGLSGNRRLINQGTVNLTSGNFSFSAFPSTLDTVWFKNEGTFNVNDRLINVVSGHVGKAIITNSSTGIINKINAGTLTLGVNIFDNLGEVNINEGTISVSGSGVAYGTQTGNYTISTGCILAGLALNYKGLNFTNNGLVTNSGLTFNGISTQNLNGTGSINTLTINNANGVDLGGTQTINNGFTLTSGKLTLNNNDLLLSSAIINNTGSASSYIVTNGTGSFRKRVINNNTNVLFPVGLTSSYLPLNIKLTAASTADDFKVRVDDEFNSDYNPPGSPSGVTIEEHLVKRMWMVSEANAGGSDATIQFNWNAGDEGNLFNRTNINVAQYDGSDWQTSTYGTATGTGPYSFSRSGITLFRELAISDNLAELNGIVWNEDADNDGFGNPSVAQFAGMQPAGYVANSNDCDDTNNAVHPGATEVCNDIDDDCDALIDDADPGVTGQPTWYKDADGDGYGDQASSVLACDQPQGYVSNDDDCDDNNVTVNQNVNAGTINGPVFLCKGQSATYQSNGNSGGVWSTSNPAIATIHTSTGLLTALNGGDIQVIYSFPSGCSGQVTAQFNVQISPLSVGNAGNITGQSAICIGASTQYASNGDANGSWSSSNPNIASVNIITGEVTGVNAGNTTIIYTINGCLGIVTSQKNITVNPNVNAGTITGPVFLCKGQSATYKSNGNSGGVWSTSNPAIATIHTSTGLLTALNGGDIQVIYSIPSGCGSPVSSQFNVQLSPISVGNAGNITGQSAICIGASTQYVSNGDANGSWSSSNPNIASVNPVTGEVTGVNAGNTTIIYTINGCLGIVTSQKNIIVNPNVSAGIVNGVAAICIGSGAVYFSNGTQGGTWSSSNTSVATVHPVTGMVTGINNGSSIITYTISGCGGTQQASKTIDVSTAANAGVLNGVLTVCINETTVYSSNGTPGGIWSSSNVNVATINSVSGIINALNAGATTISYSVSGCNGSKTTSRTLNVIPIATAGTINGVSSICIGASTQYSSDGTNGGAWTSSNTSVATINSATGLITSLNAGTTNITYSVDGCNSNFSASKQLSVSGNLPDFSFTGNSNFISSVVFPTEGEPAFSYRFEIKYTDTDGNLPTAGFPRMMLDFEGNGVFTDPKDLNITMLAADPLDFDVTNGKIYFINLASLPLGKNWTVQFVASESSGCQTTSQVFPGPDITVPPNLVIFADGITFSNDHPATASTITVFAKLQNTSKDTVRNFLVHLVNQYDSTEVYPDVLVTEILPESEKTVSWSIVTPTLAAWVPMQVVIDYTDVIVEINELDNQAIRPFTNGNFNVPGRINLTAGGAATNCQGNFYSICGRAIYQNTAVPLKNNSVAGATVTIHVNETGQEYTGFTNSQGNYCISFRTSSIGQYSLIISVTDFTLARDTFFSYLVVDCSNDGPDLVSEITVDDKEIFEGESITGTLKIKNVGNRNAGVTVADMYLSSTGTALAQQFPIPELAPGTFYTTAFSFISPITNGTETIRSRADVNNDISELKENNNSNVAYVKICPLLPDLTASGPSRAGLTPFFYLCDSRVKFSINNPSCIDMTEPFDVQYQLFENSVLIKSERLTITQIIPREKGISFTVDNLFPSAGNYVLKLYADINNAVGEFNETNNLYSSKIIIYDCKADLSIRISCSPVIPQDPAIGSTISVQATISNDGIAAVSKPFIVDFEVNGNHYPLTISTAIPSGSSLPVSMTIPTPAYGCPVINAIVDATDVIEEYDEDGEAHADLSWDFSLGRQCFELYPEDPKPNPNFWEEPHNAGEPVALAIGLINHKSYSASLVRTRFEVSGPQINGWLDLGFVNTTNVSRSCFRCETSSDISPHEVALPNSFVFPDVGTYQVRMTADWDSRYEECREDNNVMIVDVTITSSPDYRTLSKYIAPSLLNPEIGEPITIDVTYQNIGASNIVDSVDVLVKVDDLPHQKVRSKGLLSSSTYTVHFSNQWASMKEGLHVIRAIVDPDRKMTETNEFNNEATRSFVVGKAADLYFQVFTLSNSFPLIGEQITINARIGNRGALASESDLQFFYLNDNNDTVFIDSKHISVNGRDSITVSIPWSVLDNSTTLIGRLTNFNILQIRYDDKEATAFLDNIGVALTSKDACYGGADGSLTASMLGGNAPFAFNWSNGKSGNIMLAPPGTYMVTVVDAAGVARFKEGKIKGKHAPSFYEDADGDGFGNPNSIIEDCEQPIGYVTDFTDCDDRNLNVFPGAKEVCNEIDDNCNGEIDEGVKSTFYIDEDADGFGNPDVFVEVCTIPNGYVTNNLDCNDAVYGAHPGGIEICNGIDDDCDDLVDEGLLITFYRDADGDGFGNPNATTQDCTAPAGFVIDNTDCNDDPNQHGAIINPAANEICNGLDDNCNGQIDENVLLPFYRDADGDGYGNPAVSKLACSAPMGYVSNNTDCNDLNGSIHPAETEICNGIDDNCNGLTDDSDPEISGQSSWFEDSDGDGYGNPNSIRLSCNQPGGFVIDNTDCNDDNVNVYPQSTEICNGIDDNCDGLIDENVILTIFQDADGDGFGNPNMAAHACTITAGYVANNNDCNDNNPAVYPGATEACNGMDDNCNGTIDEGCGGGCAMTVNAGPDEWSYFGYSADQTIIHTAVITGGTAPFTYKWTLNRPLKCNVTKASGDELFSGGTCQNTTCPNNSIETTLSANPSCTGSATINAMLLEEAIACISVTDKNGCIATDCFKIIAEDARCYAGNSPNHKVWICHKTNSQKNPWQQICVDDNAVASHLAHGDYVGKCNLNDRENHEENIIDDLIVYPNPAHDKLNVQLNSSKQVECVFQLVDMTGRVVILKRNTIKRGSNLLELDLKDYSKGIYILSVMGSEGSRHLRVVVE